MIKLKDILNEKKEPVNEYGDWWAKMSAAQQDDYIKKHPGSEQAKDDADIKVQKKKFKHDQKKKQAAAKKKNVNEKKEFKGDLNKIKNLAKKKSDSTVARIEVADRLPHKSMSETYNYIYQLEVKMGQTPALKKVRDDADKILFKLVKGWVSNPDDVIKALKM